MSERPEPRELFVLARTICEEAQGTDDIVQVRSDVIRLYNIVVQMTDDNERLRAKVNGLHSCIDDARVIVSIGVELMPDDLIDRWIGVRSWLEGGTQDYLQRAALRQARGETGGGA